MILYEQVGELVLYLIREGYSISFSYDSNIQGEMLKVKLSKEKIDNGLIWRRYSETLVTATKEHLERLPKYISRMKVDVDIQLEEI